MAKRYAKVVAGVIENIGVANAPEDAPGCVEMDDVLDAEIGIGDLYNGSVFSKVPLPPKTPEELAEKARRALVATAKAEAKADAVVQEIRDATTTEVVNYVVSRLPSLTPAERQLIAKMAVILSVLAKESLR